MHHCFRCRWYQCFCTNHLKVLPSCPRDRDWETSGSAVTSGAVIVPSPYRNDTTRPDITGLTISGSSTQPAYAYRAAISVASGWGDGRVASGVFASTGNVISFGRDNSGSPVANSGVGESTIQANLTSTTSGDAATKIYFAGGSQAFGANPFL